MHKTFKMMSIVFLKQYLKPQVECHIILLKMQHYSFFIHTSSVSPNSFTVKMTQQDCETLGFLSFRKLPQQRQQKLLIVKHIFAKNVEIQIPYCAFHPSLPPLLMHQELSLQTWLISVYVYQHHLCFSNPIDNKDLL